MHILLLTHGYPPTISGVTLVVQKIARAMVKRGHTVTVVTASERGKPYHDQDQGVRLIRVRSTPNPFWSEGPVPILSYDQLKQIVKEVQPDIINTHDGALLSLQLYRLEQDKGRIPEVLTCHYLPEFVNYYLNVGDVLERIIGDIAWEYTIRMINGFDHVIFPSQTQRQTFLHQGLKRPSTVISNGLDITRYRPDADHQEDITNRYSLPSGPRILFVGRIAKDKRIELLIRAMPRIKTKHKVHLLLVGRGDDQKRLGEIAEKLGVKDYVHFLGFVPEEDLPAIYRAADIFAIASDVEVQSIPTLQAAATGLPIVAVDAAALPEIVHHERNGNLVPSDDPVAFADAFQRILSNPDRIAAFARASLTIGREHSEELTFDAYEKLYQEILAAYGSKTAVSS